jgi:hypothetical protein
MLPLHFMITYFEFSSVPASALLISVSTTERSTSS